ncbi:MAG: hypothetical protein FJX02_04110 [Alphaproteobacteria bacterium]|nr:hypothetical protein [Alphaproteobacteria bacterium]
MRFIPAPPIGPALPAAALVALVAWVCLAALMGWLDNAQGGVTGNGIMKAIQLKPWIDDPASAGLDASNYLLFPVYGTLCRILDAMGVMAGDPRRQIAFLNTICGGLAAATVYLLAIALGAARATAAAATLFHLACHYVLVLAIVNEDAMPAYLPVLAAMALAAVRFDRPTPAIVAAVSALFALGWLVEWRLMFPTLPAFALALWLGGTSMRQRAIAIATFAATQIVVVAAVALYWRGHPGAADVPTLFFTGKGVESAWAGFTWLKLRYLAEGMSGYLWGLALPTLNPTAGWDLWRYGGLAMLVVLGWTGWRAAHRHLPPARARSVLAIFGGTALAGAVFNLYSQPQDPQMQLNVMPWVGVAWLALLLDAAPARRRALVAASVLLLAYNIASLLPYRGEDSRWRAALARLEAAADPARTVFVVHEFDWAKPYMEAQWGSTRSGIETLPRAPAEQPKLKWIGFLGRAIPEHRRSDAELADFLRRDIEAARALGYDIVVGPIWSIDFAQLLIRSGMVASSARLQALRAALHDNFDAAPLFDDPTSGAWYRLTPKRR